MIAGIAWPDLVIAAILIIAALKGFSRGFVSELAGAVAVTAALITPWYYNGSFDDVLKTQVHLGEGSAHVVGMFLTGIITYVLIVAASWVLNRFAKLPVITIANSAAGAAVGLAKGVVLVWLLLFVALYFPLSPDIRRDLHDSRLAGYFTAPDPNVDKSLLAAVPWFARPFLMPYVHRHHV